MDRQVEGNQMSGYGVPGIPGRSAGTDPESARLDEQRLDEAARRHEPGEDATSHKKREGGFFSRLFNRRSPD
jgi:hypothetical protein